MEVARLYVDAQRSFVALCETLSDDEWATPVPCTPGWTVRDVLSHVAGLADDVRHGNVEGAATAPWTSTQVERWRATPWRQLVDRWAQQSLTVGAMLESVGEERPPIDCHTHEHDVRHAIGRPGNRGSELIELMVERFAARPVGERSLAIEFVDADRVVIDGRGERLVLRGITGFEFVRSRLGRRSRAQVRTYSWSRAPDDEMLDRWFVFGPSERDIVE